MRQKNQNRQHDILFILVSSFIVVVAWIGFNIYHIYATSTISQHIQYQLTPVSPSFNQQVIQQLKNREDVNPLFEQQGVASQSASISQASSLSSGELPTPSVIPNASQSSSIAPSSETSNGQGQ